MRSRLFLHPVGVLAAWRMAFVLGGTALAGCATGNTSELATTTSACVTPPCSTTSTGQGAGGTGQGGSEPGGAGGTGEPGGAGPGGAGGVGGTTGAGGGGDVEHTPLTALWAASSQGTGQAFVTDLAIGPSSHVIAVGTMSGSVSFGGPPLAANPADVFLAAFNVDGSALWSRRFGDNNYQVASGVAVDSAGNLIVAGTFLGNLNLGGGNLTANGSLFSDVFVAKLDPIGGHIWSRRFGDSNVQEVHGVAVDADDNIVLVGTFQNQLDFGAGPLFTTGDRDAFLAKLTPDGSPIFSRQFGASATQAGTAVAVAGNGDIVIGGHTEGTIELGGGLLVPPNAEARGFVARFDASGTHLFSRLFLGSGSTVSTLSIDPIGSVLVAGGYSGSVDLGGGPIAPAGSGENVFLAWYSVTGTPQGQRVYGGPSALGLSVATTSDGEPILAGRFSGLMTVPPAGGGDDLLFSSAGSNDGFVLQLAPSGHRFRQYGDQGFQSATAVEVTGSDDFLVAGNFSGQINVGGTVLLGEEDIFLARYAASK